MIEAKKIETEIKNDSGEKIVFRPIYSIDINPHCCIPIRETKGLSADSITITSKGTFIGHSDSWHGGQEIIKGLLTENKFDPDKLTSAKIYRFPNLTLPRDKVNLINNKYNSKVVRDSDKADVMVISHKFLNKMTDHMWKSPQHFTKSEALAFYSKSVGNGDIFAPCAIEKLDKFFSTVEEDSYFSWDGSHYYGDSVPQHIKDWTDTWVHKGSGKGYTYYVKDVFVEKFEDLLKNLDKLVWDTELNDIATSDSVPLDEKTFKRLVEMVNSNDYDNISLALEIMANCNIEQSKTYICLLFYFHNNAMKNAVGWNHVNFKALKTQFSKYINSWGFHYGSAYDQLVKFLIEDKALTEFAVNVIAVSMFKNVLGNTFGVQAKGVFQIDPSVLVLREKYKKEIKRKDLDTEPFLPF